MLTIKQISLIFKVFELITQSTFVICLPTIKPMSQQLVPLRALVASHLKDEQGKPNGGVNSCNDHVAAA